MELYQLKTFITVAREGHLTRAAERLHTSQPSVSAHIKALEEELGIPLFIRTPKGMVLTGEGEVLQTQAQKALATVDEIHHKANVLKDEVTGPVKIGLHIDPRFLRIDALLARMQKMHRNLDFHLLQRWTWQQPDDLKRGKLDAGFVYGKPDTPDFGAISIRKLNVVVTGPVEWEDRISGAKWEDMAKLPWVWTPPNCTFTKIGLEAFHARKLKPKRITVADQEPVIQALVTSGVGVAFMIEEEALIAKEEGKVVLWDKVVGTEELFFIYLEKRETEPLVKAVIQAIRRIWKV